MEDAMLNLVIGVNTGPYAWVEQQMTHGRCRLVKSYNRASYGNRAVLRDPAKQVVVRFVRGGRMYAGLIPKMSTRVQRAPVNTLAPKFGHMPVSAPAPVRAAAQHSMQQMLGNLTAIEAANRQQALRASAG